MARCSSPGLLPRKYWRTKHPLDIRTGRIAASLRLWSVPDLHPSRSRKVFGCRSSLIIFPPLGSTFQRTPCGGWRFSAPEGVTLYRPAPALPVSRLSPVRLEETAGPKKAEDRLPLRMSPLRLGPGAVYGCNSSLGLLLATATATAPGLLGLLFLLFLLLGTAALTLRHAWHHLLVRLRSGWGIHPTTLKGYHGP